MKERPNPGDAKKTLYAVLQTSGLRIVPSYVAQDLADLRRACPSDEAFAAAVLAVGREIGRALAAPTTFGTPVEHELAGWRRTKFPSVRGGEAHLRLVFRAAANGGMDVLAFGDRHVPDSVYLIAKGRQRRKKH